VSEQSIESTLEKEMEKISNQTLQKLEEEIKPIAYKIAILKVKSRIHERSRETL